MNTSRSALARHPAAVALANLDEALGAWQTAHADEVGGDAVYDLVDTVKQTVENLRPRQAAPRVVPRCGLCASSTDATVSVEYTLRGFRKLEFACQKHMVEIQQTWTADQDPAFGELDLAGTTTLAAYQVMPGMQTWTEASPLWMEVAWAYVVAKTEVFRGRGGELRVRWTFEDVKIREFGFDEPVMGYFREPEPQAAADLSSEPN